MSARYIIEELKKRCGVSEKLAWAYLPVWERECGPVKGEQDLARLVHYIVTHL